MSQPEQFDVLVLGGGTAGKLVAWHMARSGRRTAAIERRWVGGACPNIACMPSKNEIRSAEVAHLARDAARASATMTGPVKVDMTKVVQRKREMVEAQVATHLQNYQSERRRARHGRGRFVAPKTVEVSLNDGSTRTLAGAQTVPQPRNPRPDPGHSGPQGAKPLTHVEALELDVLPAHLIVHRRRLCRARTRAGLSPLRGRSDDPRGRAPAHGRARTPTSRMKSGRLLERRRTRDPPRGRASQGRGPIRKGGQRRHSLQRGRTNDRGQPHPRRGRAGSEHDRNRARQGRRRAATRAAMSASTSGWRRARRASGPSANAPAAPSSPTYPRTTFASSATIWPGESARPATGSSPIACSPTRRSPMWA